MIGRGVIAGPTGAAEGPVRRPRRRRALAFAVVIASLCGTPAAACGIELILAMDVSRSVVTAEHRLQMDGIAAAFRNPEVAAAIAFVTGGIMVAMTQWSGPEQHEQVLPWTRIESPEQATEFAQSVAGVGRRFNDSYTAIGEALLHASRISDKNPVRCSRRIVDVSGDGANNRGRAPREIADAMAATGIVINGLVIAGAEPDPVEYYRENVVRGQGAFIEVANGFEDYPRAILRKLVRELSPAVAAR